MPSRRARATISSKGQVTIPLEIRQRLGLKEGDRLEFVNEGGLTVLRPARNDENPFLEHVGRHPLPDGRTAVEWARDLRDDADEEPQTRES